LNIIDGTNLERNLYLSTQLVEVGIPVVVAVNMMDVVAKNGDEIHTEQLSKVLGCEVYEISALKGTGVMMAAEAAVRTAGKAVKTVPQHSFSDSVEKAIAKIETELLQEIPKEQKRWYAIKLFERDSKVAEKLNISADQMAKVEKDIAACETEMDDDAESIITGERYSYIDSIIKSCYKKKTVHKDTTSDKIDRIVTNRFAALPIFALVMFIVYYISVTTVGTWATDWANDGVFGDGWHLTGGSAYGEADEEYLDAASVVGGFIDWATEEGLDTDEVAEAFDSEADEYDPEAAKAAVEEFAAQFAETDVATYYIEDEETLEDVETTATGEDLTAALAVLDSYEYEEPDPADYGIWVPGVPVLVEKLLDSMGCADWLEGLILDGIVAGVGAVLGFVPQMLVLFFFLAVLESCGYMARIAFIMDRIFRKFGLSGKSFIPILIGTGCGVPGIMASRTIENEKDRRMTIMTTTFIPCGAKLPFIAMVAGAIFGGAAWVAPSAYFVGILAIICSGIILKKTKLFEGDPAPFVMELPAYHWPTVGNVLRSMWERGWSFIKKAGTIILLSTILVWFTSYFGFTEDGFRMLEENELNLSILATVGNAIAWIFVPLGWGNWQATVAAITGLVAKENIVGTLGILYSAGEGSVYANMAARFTLAAGYSFLCFNLLCAPCFAAMGAIKREMNSNKWFWTAIGYQCGFAYLVALVVYQFGRIFTGEGVSIFMIAAVAVLIYFFYMLLRPAKKKA
jgi:ferrous iron transport protein B